MSTALEEKTLPAEKVAMMTPQVDLETLPASELFFNREASLLEFHRRVLEEALDRTNPPLERLKFLSIFSSNIDEFFMIRVSGLKEELEEEVDQLSLDGMTPGEQLQMIRERVTPMVAEQQRCLTQEILTQLKSEGVAVVSYNSLNAAEKKALDAYYKEKVFPY
jgi:polyphosphate kinase